MGCECKNYQSEIEAQRKAILEFGKLFVKRMTEDSPHHDRRRKDFNQAIFFYDTLSKDYKPVWTETTLDMIMKCFDDALEDWRKTWCDDPNCKRR